MKLSIPNPFASFPALKIWLRMPAFTGWLSLSTGIALAELFPASKVLPLYISGVSFAILFFLFPALLCKISLLRIVSFFLLGYCLFTNQVHKEHTFYSQLDTVLTPNNKTYLSGKVISTPLYVKGNYSFLCAADQLFTDRDTSNVQGKIITCKSRYAPPSYGTILCQGKYRAPSRATNPYAFDEYSFFSAQRIWGKFSVDSLITVSPATSYLSSFSLATRETVYQTISHVQDNALQGILQAAFLGEKNNLTPKIKSAFREAGIYHLLAISGLHVAILISSILLILNFIPISRAGKIILAVLFIWSYLFFIGMIPSLFRAVIMATLILLSALVQRNNHVINSLGIAGIAWLSMSPASLFAAGYQLSFAATFGIITLLDVFQSRDKSAPSNSLFSFFVKVIRSSFLVSLAGFIATTPVLIYHFGRISLFGLIANIFAVVLMGLAMNSFFIGIAAQMLFEPFSILFMKITQFLLSLITYIAELSHFVPGASIALPVPYTEFFVLYFITVIGLATIDKKHLLRYVYGTVSCLFLVSPIIMLYHSSPAYSEITFFSIKQQNLAGIRFPNKKIWLIGSFAENPPPQTYTYAIHPWFRHFMIKEYDAVLLTTAGTNMVHTITPFISELRPNKVITCGEIRDKLPEEDFDSFLIDHKIDRIKAASGWRFIPAPQCTISIDWYDKDHAWFEKIRPAVIRVSFNGIHVSINNSANIKSENSIHINNTDVYSRSLEITGSFEDTSKKIFSTKNDGAIRLRIFRDGRVKKWHYRIDAMKCEN